MPQYKEDPLEELARIVSGREFEVEECSNDGTHDLECHPAPHQKFQTSSDRSGVHDELERLNGELARAFFDRSMDLVNPWYG